MLLVDSYFQLYSILFVEKFSIKPYLKLIILYYSILYLIILYYIILYYITLHDIILYYIILYYIILYYTILFYIILYHIMILCSTLLHCVIFLFYSINFLNFFLLTCRNFLHSMSFCILMPK